MSATCAHLAQAVSLRGRGTLRDSATVHARDVGGRELQRHSRGQRDVHRLHQDSSDRQGGALYLHQSAYVGRK